LTIAIVGINQLCDLIVLKFLDVTCPRIFGPSIS
jgi:hypothetical protein